MTTDHTPEPWFAYDCNAGTGIGAVDTDDGEHLNLGAMESEANAAHIVACVNACAGINPEAVPEMLKALSACLEALNVAFQADENPFGVHHNAAADAVDAAEVAIAKATG